MQCPCLCSQLRCWSASWFRLSCGLASIYSSRLRISVFMCCVWDHGECVSNGLACCRELIYCRVAIRHQCLVVSLIIEVLPISSCVAPSCGVLCYTFFFLLSVLLRVKLHKLRLVGNCRPINLPSISVPCGCHPLGFVIPPLGPIKARDPLLLVSTRVIVASTNSPPFTSD